MNGPLFIYLSISGIVPKLPGGLQVGGVFRFRSTNYPGRIFRHRDFKVWLDKESNDDLYVKDSSFKIVKGLNGKGRCVCVCVCVCERERECVCKIKHLLIYMQFR